MDDDNDGDYRNFYDNFEEFFSLVKYTNIMTEMPERNCSSLNMVSLSQCRMQIVKNIWKHLSL